MDNNQLDLGRIYGLTGCPEGGCVYTGEVIPNIPSLEQIAAVNYAQQYLNPRYANPEFQQGVTELEQTLEAARQQAALQQAAREQASIGGSTPPLTGMPMAGMPSAAQGTGTGMMPGMTSAAQTTGTGMMPGMTPAMIAEEAANSASGMMSAGMQSANNDLAPITEYNQPYPITAESIQYLNGFLRTQIGRRVEIQMLVGTDNLVTKEGYLLGVGANYILINELGTSDITTCDFYNIKFVRFFYD